MEQNTNLRKETSGRKPFIKVLVSVLVAALAAFVMLPLTSSMTRQDVMAEETANVTVRKVDEERNLLKDAVLHIEDANGNIVVEEWTSTDLPGGDKKVNLTAGTYYIVEDAAPGGYKKLEDKVEFVVDEPTIITSPTADTDGKPIKLPGYNPSDLTKPIQNTILNLQSDKIDSAYGFGANAFSGRDQNGVEMPAGVPVYCMEPTIGVHQTEYQVIEFSNRYFTA